MVVVNTACQGVRAVTVAVVTAKGRCSFTPLHRYREWPVSCRTGPLRVARPLRGVYTGLGGMVVFGPAVGRGSMILANGQAKDVRVTQTS